ncbi:dihydrofolate reductase family protein [Microlunatus soli]|uniref:RibD C-terminal domain-containing protein n=1 Tax=Microlunatus soli TaxID=630515 RepID=A0A1H1QZS0_9ACTN|nr:dihydrofolate reductase family protein [Microlunatus soli]SDS28765.1 RibD C-terminal domain-containing protein [Microlunatus soli]
MTITVIEFITLDGIISDPDGSGGTAGGGWAFRYGPDSVAGDKFRLGPILDDGVLLLGRQTWQLFATIWPGRDDPFAARMNAVPKLVASRSLSDVSAWPGSELITGDLVEVIKSEHHDVVVAGSLSVVRSLAAVDLIDEYRLLTFPIVIGSGDRLFPDDATVELECVSVEQSGAAVLSRYARPVGR